MISYQLSFNILSLKKRKEEQGKSRTKGNVTAKAVLSIHHIYSWFI
jgi:hypothetical protein